jgi:hypothetical protein
METEPLRGTQRADWRSMVAGGYAFAEMAVMAAGIYMHMV